jgi:hypothetical protein
MFQYDRPTDTRQWAEYNRQVRGWIGELLVIPGALSFMAYRTADGASPNTTTMLEFCSLEGARQAIASAQLKEVFQSLRAVGAHPKVLLVERSPFTPETIRV